MNKPSTPDEFDIFISYAHSDDVGDIVAGLRDQLEADFQHLLQRRIEIFRDRDDIRDFHDWKVRCHHALRASQFFIVLLSPAYLASDACRWEWVEWLKRERERGQDGVGAACLWFIEIARLDAPDDAERLRQWKHDFGQRFNVAFHEWSKGGREALLDSAAKTELEKLTQHVAQHLRLLAQVRGQRGNLGWPQDRFVGREPELRRLREHLLDAAPSAPVALIGIGGIGKTALALTFAFREADSFLGGRWLLRCEGHARLDAAMRPLVQDLGIELTEREKLDDTLVASRVLTVLRERGLALFLLDNVDKPALLAPDSLALLSGESSIRLLATTRSAPSAFAAVGATIKEINLDQLPEDQALDLIRLHQPDATFASTADEKDAREIVRALGGLTLAVETAAVYLGQNDPRTNPRHAVRIPDYLENLRLDLASTGEVEPGVRPGDAIKQLREVAATIRPTLERLDAPARTVLQIAALLHPDGVALPWLRAVAGKFHLTIASDADIGERDEWTDLIQTLIGMRLLHRTSEPRVLTIHRLLHRVLDTELREKRENLDAALFEHIKARDAALRQIANWQAARWELPPLTSLVCVWDETHHREVGALMNNAGNCWRHLADWSQAEPLMRRALAIAEARHGENHSTVASCLSNLAGLLMDTNRLAEAEPMYRRALAIDEAVFGKYHPNVALHLSNLAQLLQATNRLAEAESLMRCALAMYEASFGKDHPKVAPPLNNLAQLLQATNRLAEAEPLMRRALAIEETSYGKEHPKVAIHLNNLAALMRATNRLAEAEPLIRRALAIDESSLGSEHPFISIRLSNLAGLLQDTNRLAEAEPMYRRALAIDEASFGKVHPEVATDLNNLAGLLKDTNRLAEAEPMYRRALAIDEVSFGKDHPNVATGLSNLAGLLQDANRLAEAEPMYRRALAIDEASFGKDHPKVATILNSLAGLLRATNRLAEAEPLMRRALAIDVTSFGKDHPKVALSLNSLAGLLRTTGRFAEAEPMYRRALSIDEASLGRNHPEVAKDLNNLALLLDDTKRFAEAEPMYRRALAIDEVSLGRDHPDVARYLGNLAQLLQATNRLAEAEPLMRRSLVINQASFGKDHPNVAIQLNNLARLLQATNRLSEAEPLMRRHLEIFLHFTRDTGHQHPHLQAAFKNYGRLLKQMGRNAVQVLADLNNVARPFGIQFG